MRVCLVLDDGMKGPTRLKPWKFWLEVEEGIQPAVENGVDIRQGRAKGGEVPIEVRGNLGRCLFRVGQDVWIEVREGVQPLLGTCIWLGVSIASESPRAKLPANAHVGSFPVLLPDLLSNLSHPYGAETLALALRGINVLRGGKTS